MRKDNLTHSRTSVYNINYQDEYLLKSDGEVEGYDPVDPITVKVVGTKDSEGDIADSLKVKSLDSTVFTESSMEELAKKLEPKLTPEPPKVEEPEPADENENTDPGNGGPSTEPSDSGSNSGGNSGGSGSSGGGSSSSSGDSTNGSGSAYSGAAGPEVTDDGLVIKENNIVALDNAPGAGNRLAKTGGFIGTLVGYLAAIGLIAVGILLVCGKEKRVK